MSVEKHVRLQGHESSVIASLQDLLRLEDERLEEESRLAAERVEAVREANRIAIEAARVAETKRLADAAAERDAAAAIAREREIRARAIEEAERLRVVAEEHRKTQREKWHADTERDVRVKAVEEEAKKTRLRRWLGAVCTAMMLTVIGASGYYAGVLAPAQRAQEAERSAQTQRVAALQQQVATLTAKLAVARTPDEMQDVQAALATTSADLDAAQNAARHDAKQRTAATSTGAAARPPTTDVKIRPTCKEGDPMAQLDCVKR